MAERRLAVRLEGDGRGRRTPPPPPGTSGPDEAGHLRRRALPSAETRRPLHSRPSHRRRLTLWPLGLGKDLPPRTFLLMTIFTTIHAKLSNNTPEKKSEILAQYCVWILRYFRPL